MVPLAQEAEQELQLDHSFHTPSTGVTQAGKNSSQHMHECAREVSGQTYLDTQLCCRIWSVSLGPHTVPHRTEGVYRFESAT